MPGPLGQLKCLRASWADPLGRTYDLTSLAAAPAAAPAMANAAAADYTMPQDVTEQIIQQLWRVDVLAPRAAAVNQGCSLAAKRAAATLSVDDIAVADTRCLTRYLARDTLGRRELVPTHTLDAARPGTRHVRHPGPLLRLGRLPSSCS